MSRQPHSFPLPDNIKVRIAGRLGMQFFLNCMRIFGDGYELTDGILLLGLRHANVEHLGKTPILERALAESPDTLPPNVLRPISVNALANSLGLPFETVRRRITKLKGDGELQRLPDGGLLISASRVTSERQRYEGVATSRQLRNLLEGLADLELLPRLPPAEAPLLTPWTTVSRLVAQYCLRQLNALTENVGHVAHGLMLIHVIRGSTEHLDDTYTEVTQTDDLVKDKHRRPVSVALLANRIGLPHETARRHAAALVEKGLAARSSEGGLYLTQKMLLAEPWPTARRTNVANLSHLFGRLDDAYRLVAPAAAMEQAGSAAGSVQRSL